MSRTNQIFRLEEILARIENHGIYKAEALRIIVKTLLLEDDWTLARVLAHIDLLDLELRT